MFSIKPLIRLDRINSDNTAQIYLAIRRNRQQCMHATGIRINVDDWDASAGRLSSQAKLARIYNPLIEVRVADAIKTGFEMEAADASVTPSQLNARLSGREKPQKGTLFMEQLQEYMRRCKTDGTRTLYLSTRNRIRDFEKNYEKLTFDDITVDWLRRFDDFLSKTSPSPNARGIHLRNIRAIFNDAITRELTEKYPFRRFKIKTEETAKRSMQLEQLRAIFSVEVEGWQQRYLDFFKLSFLLIGINAADLLTLPLTAIVGGRLKYRRAKTHRLYSIKVEPEAMAILEKYKGQGYLLNFMDSCKHYRLVYNRLAPALKQIGAKIGLPELTTYWARHTWATLARKLKISMDDIALALGHSNGHETTRIYIDEDLAAVDEANRRVIDWVLYNKK